MSPKASRRPARLLLPAALLVLAAAPVAAQSATGEPDWIAIDYAELIDRRQLSHSGESVEMLLARLGGRPLPPPGERPADRTAHVLLDPLLEPYAFVLSDVLDALTPVADPPLVEVGGLWRAGEPQPAWAALLEARRMIVESDGAGRIRAIVPEVGPEGSAAAAAARAWEAAWPVLRHVLAAERRRLRAGAATGGEDADDGTDAAPALRVEAYAYRHRPERLRFELGTVPHTVEVRDTRDRRGRAPFDPGRVRAFLEQGLRLEGGRLEEDGTLRLLGSPGDRRAELLGAPLTAADFAVAYRAVFRGGLAEPYMSLDRGYSPQTAIVNYGGRLRDTRLGWVSLLCDIRFKTFSQGLGIAEGRDLRPEIRGRLPEFATHLERFAWDPASGEVESQQTRLWFYPDDVDLTLSPQGDVLVLRRARMTAASERVTDETLAPARGADPPWTRLTVAAINADYDGLAGLFPELADLDSAVRLLSLFTWLRMAEAEGRAVPDLDVLLSLELPAAPTPRRYPHLLAFNALPPAGGTGPVDVIDRVAVGESLERLNPADGRPLPALRRFRRALSGLDPRDPRNAPLVAELSGYDVGALAPSQLDLLAHRAERVRMHQTVLSTLPRQDRERLLERQGRGEELRVFSVGIGGIDLGMEQALARARGRSRGLGWTGEGGTTAPGAAAAASPEGTRRPAPAEAPELDAGVALPSHGAAGSREGFLARRAPSPAGAVVVETVYDADGPEARARRLVLDATGRAAGFLRYEGGRLSSYRLEREGGTVRVRLAGAAPAPPAAAGGERPAGASVPDGLLLVDLRATPETDARADAPIVLVARRSGPQEEPTTATLTRRGAQQLLLGREIAGPPDDSLSALDALDAAAGEAATWMLLADAPALAPPWEQGAAPVAGEEDPLQVARALATWRGGAVVGADPVASPARWRAAPGVPKRGALLLLPPDGFPEPFAALRDAVGAAWEGERVSGTLPDGKKLPELVVLVAAEGPGPFAARLRRLARDPAMRGRLLAAWNLTGAVRRDLPASLIGEGRLAGLGIAEGGVAGLRGAPGTLGAYDRALGEARGGRVERLAGPFLWFF